MDSNIFFLILILFMPLASMYVFGFWPSILIAPVLCFIYASAPVWIGKHEFHAYYPSKYTERVSGDCRDHINTMQDIGIAGQCSFSLGPVEVFGPVSCVQVEGRRDSCG